MGAVQRGRHTNKGHPYRSVRGSYRPLSIWSADIVSDAPVTAGLFLFGGTVGWAVFGLVLWFDPNGAVGPLLGAAFVAVCTEYWAWWRLGGHLGMLMPRSLALIGQVLRLPVGVAPTLAYSAAAVVAVGADVRRAHGGDVTAAGRAWMVTMAKGGFAVATIAASVLVLIGAAVEVQRQVGYEVVGRPPRFRGLRTVVNVWLFRIGLAAGTVSAFLITLARRG